MILIASNGHLLTHIPHPIHKISEIKQIVEVFVTSMQSLSALFTGHVFLHSRPHFLGLHLSGLMIAILSLSFDSTILNNTIKLNAKIIYYFLPIILIY
mgnify:CR=1 FL=1